MLKFSALVVIISAFLVISCSNKELPGAQKLSTKNYIIGNKKPGYNPLKHGFNCDSLHANAVDFGNYTGKIIVILGSTNVDTINVLANRIAKGAGKDLIIADFNFDGFCDIVLPDIASAQNGGMNYYYYLYDNQLLKYNEVKSLPKFISEFKLDVKNQRVKIYCPNQDCFAYYKYNENDQFELVQGEYKATP